VSIQVTVLDNAEGAPLYRLPTIFEESEGFVLFPKIDPPTPVIQVPMKAFVAGSRSDNCSRVELGFVQFILGYSGQVRWESRSRGGPLAVWSWSIEPKVPIRDSADDPDERPWYAKVLNKTVAQCGTSTTVTFIDSPDLIRDIGQPPGFTPGFAPTGSGDPRLRLIPWTDPYTRSSFVLISVLLDVNFATWLVANDPSHKPPLYPLRMFTWGFTVRTRLDPLRSIGQRQVGFVAIPRAVVVRAAAGSEFQEKSTKEILSGPKGRIVLRANRQ
jgi:hypothetical protein